MPPRDATGRRYLTAFFNMVTPRCDNLSIILAGLWDGFVAIVIVFVAQFLILGTQVLLNMADCTFPASVIAMLLVFGVFSLTGACLVGVQGFYDTHLKNPATILNKHMSIGFTIPFLMIVGKPTSSLGTIGFIIFCFVITGALSTVISYGLAFPLQSLLVRIYRPKEAGRSADVEQGFMVSNYPRSSGRARPKVISEASSMVSSQSLGLCPETDRGTVFQPPSDDQQQKSSRSLAPASRSLPGSILSAVEAESSSAQPPAQANLLVPVILVCWLLTLAVGFPVRATTGFGAPLDTFLLFSIWFTTVGIQQRLKGPTLRSRHPRLSVILASAANPVLLTSLGMMAFVFAEAHRTAHPVRAVLDAVQTGASLADLIFRNAPAHLANLRLAPSAVASSSETEALPGAGDVALALLGSGLVSWGLKLYECRAQLLSRAGATVTVIASVLAVLHVVCGPLLAHALLTLDQAAGAEMPAKALAFAARSVTLALGAPALAVLGGDTSLNAVLVVASGILFQIGLGLGADRWCGGRAGAAVRPTRTQATGAWWACEERTSNNGGTEDDNESAHKHILANDPATVAAGVTIGINSAAMGTAHLYENSHPAAPYAALAITVMGVMTVVCASIRPLAAWVMASVQS